MSTTSSDSIVDLLTSRVNIAPGSTQAFFLDVIPGQVTTTVKYISGGTLEIIGCTTNAGINDPSKIAVSTTFSVADLGALNGTGYLMGTTEILSVDGPIRVYLSSTGATTTVCLIKGRASGN